MLEAIIGWPARGLGALLDGADALFERARSRRHGDWALALFLIAPALLILAAFSLSPLVSAFIMSLYGGKQGGGSFVGLANYTEAFAREDFRRSVRVTVYYALGTVPATLVIGFFTAYALHRIVLLRGMLRTLYFLPYVTSATAAAMVWRALLNPQTGTVNQLFAMLGLPTQQWLLEPRGVLHLLSGGAIAPDSGPSLALCCIIAFDIWHSCGFAIVLFLAGLSALPREYVEAARVDGAGTGRILWHVVLPLLSPTVVFLSTIGLIRSFQAFNSFFALTQGGRALGTTENLIMHIYANFYEYGYWGYGAAVATLLSLAILLLTAVQWRVANRLAHYES